MTSALTRLPHLLGLPLSLSFTLSIIPVSLLIYLLFRLASRQPLASNAPRLWKPHDLPFLGAHKFHTGRFDFLTSAARALGRQPFSFYVGKRAVVAASGAEARAAFFESRQLDFAAGYGELFAGSPKAKSTVREEFTVFFNRTIVSLLRRDKLERNLRLLIGDVRRGCEELASAPPLPLKARGGNDEKGEWLGVVNSFNFMYCAVYQLTMRTMGAREIAEDPALLAYTLEIFESFEKSSSALRIIFPWLPTPKHLKRMLNGARLYMVFGKIINERKRTGRREEDPVQMLMDDGLDARDVVTFTLGALFAGQVNSAINAAWLPIYWCQHPVWKARVRDEVDAVIARHRTSPDQSPADVLDTLTLDDWEASFPTIDLCLREGIRLGVPGTVFRKNTTDADIPLTLGAKSEKSGDGRDVVVPSGVLAVYLLDDAHMDPEIYEEPLSYDPGRFLPDRAEDKKQPHAFVGWGSGRHPCLGMRFAKLEMFLINAYFVAMFDFELSNRDGGPAAGFPAPLNRNNNSSQKPSQPVYMRYRKRY